MLWALASAAGSLLGALAATCRGFLRRLVGLGFGVWGLVSVRASSLAVRQLVSLVWFGLLCFTLLCFAPVWFGLVWFGLVGAGEPMESMSLYLIQGCSFNFNAHAPVLDERLWPSAGGPLGEPLVSDLEKGPGETVLASGQAKDAAPPVPEVPKARGALLRAAVAEDVSRLQAGKNLCQERHWAECSSVCFICFCVCLFKTVLSTLSTSLQYPSHPYR